MLTAEQLDLRKRLLTATDMARIVSGDEVSVALEKRGLVEVMDSPRMRAGRRLEQAIGAWAADERGIALRPCTETLVHRTVEWAGATPDFWILGPRDASGNGLAAQAVEGIMEAKNVGQQRAAEFEIAPPEKVLVQVAWQMAVTDIPYVIVAALIAGWDLRTFKIERDPDLEGDLLTIGASWWTKHVIKGQMPEPDGSKLYQDYLQRRFRDHSADYIAANSEVEEKLSNLRALVSSHAKLGKTIDKAKQEICAAIGDAEGITSSLGTVKWADVKAYTRPAVEVKAGRRLYLPRDWSKEETE